MNRIINLTCQILNITNESDYRLDSLVIILFTLGIFALGGTYRNEAVRKQRRVEDNQNAIYLSFWAKLILFPLFLFSKKPFQKRTIKYRKINLISLVIVILILLLPIPIFFKCLINLLFILWLLILVGIFNQHYRGYK